jgi:hypothetical protein
MKGTGIFPAGQLMRELILAIGAALVVGNIAVLVNERRRKPGDKRPKPNMKVVALNILIGVVLTIWGLGSLLVGGH